MLTLEPDTYCVQRPSLAVRDAQPSDLDAIVEVTRSSWHQAYSRLLPRETIRRGTSSFFTELWRAIFQDPQQGAVVIKQGGRVIACGAYGPYRTHHNPPLSAIKPGAGELFRGYVAPDAQTKGVGKALFHARLAALAEHGASDVYAWVYATNTPARGFFEHMSGRVAGFGDGKTMEFTFREVCYQFQHGATTPMKGQLV